MLFCVTNSLAQCASEHYYQMLFATAMHGRTEYSLPDHSRVDILTDSFSIEVEFSEKWANAIGQALYYSILTKKKPGILVIMGTRNSEKCLRRLLCVSSLVCIQIWVIDCRSLVWHKVNM